MLNDEDVNIYFTFLAEDVESYNEIELFGCF